MNVLEEKLFEYIKDSLKMVYEKDYPLILNRALCEKDNDDDHHVGERSIVFRFAHYLLNQLGNNKLFKEYDLDCEYNRNGAECKSLPSFPNGIYPDVIIHKRGNNDHNLAVFEFKTYWNDDLRHDIDKIKELIDKEGKYKYKFGYVILLKKYSVEITKIHDSTQMVVKLKN